MRTGFRNHGYYGHTFVGSRVLSAIALLAIIGLVATFISQVNHAQLVAPEQLTAALVITCCGFLWVMLSFTAYDDTHIPYLATAIVDAVFLVPCIAVVVVLGGPLSQTDCSTLPQQSGNVTSELASANTGGNGTLSYTTLVGEDQTTCYKLQATWGLMIALCILFVFSGIATAFMFLGKRRNGYNGRIFGKNTAQGANGPESPKKTKKSKQKKQRNGKNHQSYNKGYSFFKPSTWFGTGSADNASTTSSSRGMVSPGYNSSNNPSSTGNVNMNNQPPNSSPSKNNDTSSDARWSSAAGRWNFGFGRLWRKGSGGAAPIAKNSDPREDIVLTDVSKRQRKNDTDRTNYNTNKDNSRNMDTEDQQRELKIGGFFSRFRSKNKAPTPAGNDNHRSTQPPYAQDHAASSSRSRMANNGQGAGPRNGAVDGRAAGRPGPGVVSQSRDPNSASSKGTIPVALDSTKFGDKSVPPQKKEVTSPLNRNPVPSSSARDGRNAERSRGPAPFNKANKTNNRKNMPPLDTNLSMNDPNTVPNMRGRNINDGPGAGQAPGAANGNLTRDGERNLGFQRPGMAHRGQSPTRNVAAGYQVPDDIRNAGEPSEFKSDARKMDKKGAGLEGIDRPSRGQPQLFDKNGRLQKSAQEQTVAQNESSAKSGGSLFSNMIHPLKSKKDMTNDGLDAGQDPAKGAVGGRREEQRGPHMTGVKNSLESKQGKTDKDQTKDLSKNNIPDQQDGSRDLRILGKNKKSAATPESSQNPHVVRELSAAEASYLSTPLNAAAQEATGRGKTHAEKKGELEKRPKTGEPPVKKPHNLRPHQQPSNNGAGVAGIVPPPKHGQKQDPHSQQPGHGRSGAHTGHAIETDVPSRLGVSQERDEIGPPLPQSKPLGHGTSEHDAPATQNGKGRKLFDAHRFPGRHGKDPAHDPKLAEGRPVPQIHGRRDLPGEVQPELDSRGRPVAAQPPPAGSERRDLPAGLASDQKHQREPSEVRDERGKQGPHQKHAEADIPQPLAIGRNAREPARDEKGHLVPPGRDQRHQKLSKSEVPAALAPGRNPREDIQDGRGRPMPSGVPEERGIPDVKGLKDVNGRRQPSPPRERSRRPQSPQHGMGRRRSRDNANGGLRPPSPQPSRGRRSGSPRHERGEQAPGHGRQHSPSKPRPASPSKKQGRHGHNPNKEEISLGDSHPVQAGVAEVPFAPPSHMKNLADGKESSISRGQPLAKDGRPIPASTERPLAAEVPHMRNESTRERPMNGAANAMPQTLPPVKDTAAKKERAGSRPPPMLKDRKSLFEPVVAASDGAGPMPRPISPSLLDKKDHLKETPLDARQAGQRNEKVDLRIPTNQHGQPAHPRDARVEGVRDIHGEKVPDMSRGDRAPRQGHEAPSFDPRATPARDGRKEVRSDRDAAEKSKPPHDPRQPRPTANEFPRPHEAPVEDPRQPRSRSRGPQRLDRPMDDRQLPFPSDSKVDSTRGRAPPFPSRDLHTRENQRADVSKEDQWPTLSGTRIDDKVARPAAPASRDIENDKGNQSWEASNAPTTNENSQKPSAFNWLFGKKNKKAAEPPRPAIVAADSAAKRPSLMPPNLEQKLVSSEATVVLANPGDRENATPSKTREDPSGGQQERDTTLRSHPVPSGPDGLRRPPSPSSRREQTVDPNLPAAANGGRQRYPTDLAGQDTRGRAPPFPVHPGQKNDLQMPREDASPFNQKPEKAKELNMPPMPEVKNSGKMNRKSRVLPGMMPAFPAPEEPLPLPPFPASSSVYGGEEHPVTVDVAHMPPVPALDEKKKKVSNRKSRVLPGAGPVDLQMPAMPPMPQQTPVARRDGLPMDDGKPQGKPRSGSPQRPQDGELFLGSVKHSLPGSQSDVPPQLRPGGPQQGQRDVADKLATEQPGKQMNGLPARPNSRRLDTDVPTSTDKHTALPQAPSSEVPGSMKDAQMPDSLTPGRPGLRLKTENSTNDKLPAAPDSFPVPPLMSKTMGPETSDKPSSPKSKKDKRGKKEQMRQPLSPRDGNMSPRSPSAMDKDLALEGAGFPVPPSKTPGSPKSNKLKGLFSKGMDKGKQPGPREAGFPMLGEERPLSPKSKIIKAKLDKDTASRSDNLNKNGQMPEARDGSFLTGDVSSMQPPLYQSVFDGKDKGPKDVPSGFGLKDGQDSVPRGLDGAAPLIDGGNELSGAQAISKSQDKDKRGNSKDNSKDKLKDEDQSSSIKGLKGNKEGTPFQEGELGYDKKLDKDQLSSTGSPTIRYDEPWSTEQDPKMPGERKGGIFGLGGDENYDKKDNKKDKKRRGSRDSLTGSPIKDGFSEPGLAIGHQPGEKKPRDKKGGLFGIGRTKDQQEAHYPGMEEEKGDLLGFGKGKDKKQRPGAPGSSPTVTGGYTLKPLSSEGDLADEKDLDKNYVDNDGLDKNGLDKNGLDKNGLDKNGLDKNSLDKKKLGLFGFGKDKNDKRGNQVGSPDKKDLFSTSPRLDHETKGENTGRKSSEQGLEFFDGLDKDKKQRRNSRSLSISSKRDSVLFESAGGDMDPNAPGEKKSGSFGMFGKDKGKKQRKESQSTPLSPRKAESPAGSPKVTYEQQPNPNGFVLVPGMLVYQGELQQGSPREVEDIKSGRLSTSSMYRDQDGRPLSPQVDFSALSETDKKKIKDKKGRGKGIFGFGKGSDESNIQSPHENESENQDEKPLSPQLDFSTISEMDDRNAKKRNVKGVFGLGMGNEEDDMSPTFQNDYDDQGDGRLSPQLDFSAFEETDKKDRKGKGKFGWGKDKNTNDSTAVPEDEISMDSGKKDKKGKWFFGRNGDRDDAAQPSPEDNARLDTDMPMSPSGDWDNNTPENSDQITGTMPVSESPILDGFVESPRRSLDGDSLDSAEPEQLKPAPLNFKSRMKNFLNKVSHGDGEQDGRRQSSREVLEQPMTLDGGNMTQPTELGPSEPSYSPPADGMDRPNMGGGMSPTYGMGQEPGPEPSGMDNYSSGGMDDYGASNTDGYGAPGVESFGSPEMDSSMPMDSPMQPTPSAYGPPDTGIPPDSPALDSTFPSGPSYGGFSQEEQSLDHPGTSDNVGVPEPELGPGEDNLDSHSAPLDFDAPEPSFVEDNDDFQTYAPPADDFPNEDSNSPAEAPFSPAPMVDNFGGSSFEPAVDDGAPFADNGLVDTEPPSEMPMETSMGLPSPVGEAPMTDDVGFGPPQDTFSPQVDNSVFEAPMEEDPFQYDQVASPGFEPDMPEPAPDYSEPAPDFDDGAMDSGFEQYPVEELIEPTYGDGSSRDMPMETGLGIPDNTEEVYEPPVEYGEPDYSEPIPDSFDDRDYGDQENGGEPEFVDPPMDDMGPPAMEDDYPPPADDYFPSDEMDRELPQEEIPMEEYPMEEPPMEEYPIEEPPMQEYPSEEPPMEEYPVEEPPMEEYPGEEPPMEEYPLEEPAMEEYSLEEPPMEEMPIDGDMDRELPSEEDMAMEEEMPIQEEITMDEEFPVEEEITMEEEIPMEEEMPMEEMPMEEEVSMDGDMDRDMGMEDQELPEESQEEYPEEIPPPDEYPEEFPQGDFQEEIQEECPEEMPQEEYPEEYPEEVPQEEFQEEFQEEYPEELPQEEFPEETGEGDRELGDDFEHQEEFPEEFPEELPQEDFQEEYQEEYPEELPQEEFPEDFQEEMPEESQEEFPDDDLEELPQEEFQEEFQEEYPEEYEGDRELGEVFESQELPEEEFQEEYQEEIPEDFQEEFQEEPPEEYPEGMPEEFEEGDRELGDDEFQEEFVGEEIPEEFEEETPEELEPEELGLEGDEQPPEDEMLDYMEGDGERDLGDELEGEEISEEQMEDDMMESDPVDEEGEGEGEEEQELLEEGDNGEEMEDEFDEESDDRELDDDAALEGIMDDGTFGSPTGSDYDRGIFSPSMEEPPAELVDEPEQDEEPAEPESPSNVRLSQIYRQSAVFSPLPSATPPPSPPPEGDGNDEQDGGLDETDPIRYSQLYRQSIDLDMALSLQSPASDSGLSAIAESPNMDQDQTFEVPIMEPVPDFAKRRSERISARLSKMSQPLSPIAASPLSPRPPPSPPLDADEEYDQQSHYDSNYDLERGLSPVEDEDHQNYYDEDDEYEPHGQDDDDGESGPRGPQTFDDMNLSPRPGPSPSERYSYHEDLEQGPPMTPFTPNGNNRRTLRERMSGWWSAAGSSGSQDGQGLGLSSPPPPMPYDGGRFVAEPGSPSSLV